MCVDLLIWIEEPDPEIEAMEPFQSKAARNSFGAKVGRHF
jgi:hypothetical protein